MQPGCTAATMLEHCRAPPQVGCPEGQVAVARGRGAVLARTSMGEVYETLAWVMAAIAALAVAAVALVWVKRYVLSTRKPTQPALDLEQLRALRDRGQLTPREYDTLRRKLLGLGPVPEENPPASSPDR